MSHMLSASRSGHPSASSAQHPFLPPMPSVRDTQAYDLAFGPFQESCAAFLASLDAYVLRGKDEIQARRISHTSTMKKAAEERARLEKEIDSEGDKEGRLLKVLEKEKAEVADLEQALAELKLTLGGVETQIRLGEGDAQEREAQLQTLLRGQSRMAQRQGGGQTAADLLVFPHRAPELAEKSSREASLAQTRKAVAADLTEAELHLCIKIEGVKSADPCSASC
jgi:septal ring factor EnvC (AmiA/AmiB activator)